MTHVQHNLYVVSCYTLLLVEHHRYNHRVHKDDKGMSGLPSYMHAACSLRVLCC